MAEVTELRLVTTDADRTVLGTIRLDKNGVAVFTGGPTEKIFRSLQRAYRERPTDAVVFAVFADGGWSNGPLQLVPVTSGG